MPQKLTVLIPCKNERRNIGPCVTAARLVADEVLVADCYSTDGTLDILEQHGDCRVIQREFINFANFKNWAIPQAKHPWVLIVDADERLSETLAQEIRQLLCDPPDHFDAYAIPRRLFFMGHPIRFSGCQNDRPVRLIRRDRCRYQPRRVHEKIVPDPRRVGRLRNHLFHYSFWTYDEYLAKNLLYTELGAQDLWDQGYRTGFVNLFLRPLFRFLTLYLWNLGFLDGLKGLQLCILVTFFVSFLKQGRLWEWEHALKPPENAGLVPTAARTNSETALRTARLGLSQAPESYRWDEGRVGEGEPCPPRSFPPEELVPSSGQPEFPQVEAPVDLAPVD